MKLYEIINSRSVGEHLKRINYQFSSLEAAFLIWYSKCLTVNEKHILWNELINTMADTVIKARYNTTPHDSLHEYLRQYMAMENALIERFYSTEEGAFYTYDFYCHGDRSWCDSNNGYYRTAEECLRALEADRSFDIKHIRLTKNYFGQENSYITLYLNAGLEVFSIDECCTLSEEDSDILYGVFEGLWFNFPLPFKKGDIIQYADCPYNIFRYHDEKTLVLTDNLVPSDYLLKLHEQNGDLSDMTVWGIFCNDMGKYYHECSHTYLDFELQYKPLQKSEQAMLPLSNYLKGEISVDILCNAYHILLSEMHTDDMRRFMNITDEGMTLAGLTTE